MSSLNNIDFSSVGSSVSKDSDAFKKIQKFSKITSNNINRNISDTSSNYRKIYNLYLNPNNLNNDSSSYGTLRQINFSSANSTLPMFTTLVDKKGFNKFFEYSLNYESQNGKILERSNKFTISSRQNNELLPNINSQFLLPLNNLILNTGSSESSIYDVRCSSESSIYNTFFTK
jgi:hypothetical protein